MAKKNKKIERPKHKPTKRQLSSWQKQKRRQRIIFGVGIAFILIALVLVILGLNDCYVNEKKPLKETAIEVNGETFNMGYYIDYLSYYTGEYYYLAGYYADVVIQSIQYNELMEQEAAELGIVVSEDEIKEELKDSELPDTQVTRDIIMSQLLLEKMKEEYFDPQIEVSADQKHVMAIFLESQSQAEEVRQRILGGEEFGEIAAEMSLEAYTKQESGDLDWKPEGVIDSLLGTSVLEGFIDGYAVGTLSLPIEDTEKTKDTGYWLAMVLERDEESGEAHTKAILLGSEEEALAVKERLDEGEDFDVLAEEFSQVWSEEDGADLGWIAEGDLGGVLDSFAFDQETGLNTISQPVKDESRETIGGYWLFKVLGEEYREISEDDRGRIANQMLEEWLTQIWEDPENEILSYIDETKKQFAVDKVSEQ